MASLICVISKTACFSPKMAIAEKILILFRSPLNREIVYMSVFIIESDSLHI
jgi:hypothetical protein